MLRDTSHAQGFPFFLFLCLLFGRHSAEGIIGLYKGGHLYLLHQALRDFLRLVAERGLGAIERRPELAFREFRLRNLFLLFLLSVFSFKFRVCLRLSCEARPKAQYLGRRRAVLRAVCVCVCVCVRGWREAGTRQTGGEVLYRRLVLPCAAGLFQKHREERPGEK